VFTLLLVLLILVALVLIPVVLLQSGKGGGLAAMGSSAGTDTLFGSRQATTILTKATWWSGALFVVIAFALQLLSSRPQRPSSILRQGLQQSAPAAQAPAAAIPGVQQRPAQTPAQGTTPAPAAGQPAAPPAAAPAPAPAPAPATTP
jgi:preprotein translocase subunit SecG